MSAIKLYKKIIAMALVGLMVMQYLPASVAFAAGQGRPSSLPGRPLPVDLRTGELVLASEDLKVGIDKLPLAITRVYRSNMEQSKPGVFGHKWHCLLDMEIATKDKGLRLTDELGQSRDYVVQKEGTYGSTKYEYEVIIKQPDGTYSRQLKDGTSYDFDARGKLREVRDLNGRFLRITRTAKKDGVAIRVEDRYGRYITLNCNAAGRAVRMSDVGDRSCLYGYDKQQNLVSFRSRAGGTVEFAYDGDHRLTKVGAEGPRSYNIKYSRGKIASQGTLLGTAATYDFTVTKDRTAVAVSNSVGAVTKYEFTSNGLITVTDPAGAKNMLWLNERELPLRVVRANGRSAEVRYDERFNAVWVNNNGATTELVYGPDDTIQSLKSDTAGVVKFAYDGRRNCTRVENARGGVSSFVWNSMGQLESMSTPSGQSAKYEYDRYGHVSRILAGDGRKWEFDFTLAGILRNVMLPTGVKFTYMYNPLEQVITMSNSEGQQMALIRDQWGQVVRVVDPAGKQTAFEYDPAGLLTTVQDPIGAAMKMAYDAVGKMASFTDANGNTAEWSHDNASRLIAEKDSAGGVRSLSYNSKNELTKLVNARGQKTTLEYDEGGKVVAADRSGDQASFAYDAFGRMVRMKDGDSDYQFSFDPDGLIRSVVDGVTGLAVSYQYNAAGRRTQMTAGDEKVGYEYDAQGRLSAIRSSLGDITFAYDGVGRRSAMTYPNGVQTSYAYDKLNRLTEIRAVAKDGAEVTRYRYTYDILGNRTSVIEGKDKVTQYEYDAKSQLVKVMQGMNVTEYVYDSVGNRTSVTINGVKEEYITGRDNRLLKAGKAEFNYDADGNIVTRTQGDGKSYSYQFDAQNRLIQAKGPDGVVTYGYAPNGSRVSRSEGNGAASRFVFDQADEIAMLQGDNRTWTAVFGYGIDKPLAIRSGSKVGYYHPDGLGSTARLTDSGGKALADYQYDEFGAPIHSSSGIVNPFTYTGREWDSVANSYFYRARFFDPHIGRFLSKDPLGLSQGPVQYAYVANNPVNYVDPTGRFFGYDDAVVAGGGALVGFGTVFVHDIASGAIVNNKWSSAGAYVGATLGGAAGAEAGYYVGAASWGNPIAAGAAAGFANSFVEQVTSYGVDYGVNAATGKEQVPWDWGSFAGGLVWDTVKGAIGGFIPVLPGATDTAGKLFVHTVVDGTIGEFFSSTLDYLFYPSAANAPTVDVNGDGVPDVAVAGGFDTNGDGRPDVPYIDANGNGIPDQLEIPATAVPANSASPPPVKYAPPTVKPPVKYAPPTVKPPVKYAPAWSK